MNVLVHLVYEEEHGDIEFYAELLADIGKIVEEIGVLPTEMYRHDITLILHALGYEGLGPWYVVYLSVYASRAQSGREHEHMVVASEASLHHCREVAALVSCLIDRNAHGRKSRKVHQQIVDEVSELTVIMSAYYSSERHAVHSTERMVAYESIQSAVVLVRQILHAFYLQGHIKILDTIFQPLYTLMGTAVPQEGIHLILVYDVLQPPCKQRRHIASFTTHLAFKYVVNVYRLLCDFHFLCCIYR